MTARSRRPAAPPREAEVQRAAVAWLRARGAVVFRRNVLAMAGEYNGRRRFVRAGEPGMSDLWGFIGARHFEAETKRPGARPSLAQVLWLRRINDITGAAFWFQTIDQLARVVECLAAGGRVAYLETTRRYGGVTGPSGDFHVEWPD